MTNKKKNYIIDTNVLIENPLSVLTLRNGDDNNIFIPYHVLIELNQLKTNNRLRHIVSKVVDVLLENRDSITFIHNDSSISPFTQEIVDNYILKEIKSSSEIEDPILVTNDRILQLQAGLADIAYEDFRDSKPFESESQLFTGFNENGEKPIANSFSWVEGKPLFHGPQRRGGHKFHPQRLEREASNGLPEPRAHADAASRDRPGVRAERGRVRQDLPGSGHSPVSCPGKKDATRKFSW